MSEPAIDAAITKHFRRKALDGREVLRRKIEAAVTAEVSAGRLITRPQFEAYLATQRVLTEESVGDYIERLAVDAAA